MTIDLCPSCRYIESLARCYKVGWYRGFRRADVVRKEKRFWCFAADLLILFAWQVFLSVYIHKFGSGVSQVGR